MISLFQILQEYVDINISHLFTSVMHVAIYLQEATTTSYLNQNPLACLIIDLFTIQSANDWNSLSVNATSILLLRP